MITLRRSAERGHADYGWLDTHYTFSFNTYHDPGHMGFRDLRVINEDRVAGGKGFPPHPHNDMEIITYILAGALEHKDSSGGGGVIRRGDVQYMCAGTGVMHSEFNHSRTEQVHLLQIWILPERAGLKPRYDQKSFPDAEKLNRLRVIASSNETDGALTLHQNVALYASILEPQHHVRHELAKDRHAWLQLVTGELALNGQKLTDGDGAAVSGELSLEITASRQAEFLLFDLA
ncbi:MAG: pirin family protein [Candidatus Zixiibacteriota bacterium]